MMFFSRWESKPKIVVDEHQEKKRDASPARSSSPIASRLRDPPEPPCPAPREILHPKNKDEKLAASREKLAKDDKHGPRSPKEEKHGKRDKKREKENKFKDANDENHLSSERIIIGGEDAVRNAVNFKSRLPHEVLTQFDGKSREVNILSTEFGNVTGSFHNCIRIILLFVAGFDRTRVAAADTNHGKEQAIDRPGGLH